MKRISMLSVIFLINLIFAQTVEARGAFSGEPNYTFNVMAPLIIRDDETWAKFDEELKGMKEIGVYAVSTDVWWGLVEKSDNEFDWTYYDKLSSHIINAGLKWVPILSFHQCGGNVGDECDIPIPSWIWKKYALRFGMQEDDFKYKSEQGNVSKEYVSAFGTPFVLEDYREFMAAFQEHYAMQKDRISEINISLGPAGELRYPSYNSHDKGTGYPTRGALQSYSKLALRSFQQYALAKYMTLERLSAAWGGRFHISRAEDILPPQNVDEFFQKRMHVTTQYGQDFFDWYQDALLSHGRTLLHLATHVFTDDEASFRNIDIGAKVPGIHWRIGSKKKNHIVLSDRLAELTAGLIRTSRNDWSSDAKGRGYRDIVGMFGEMNRAQTTRHLVLHFTCLEMSDGQDKPEVRSLAKSLVSWVAAEAERQNVPLKGENALAWNLPDMKAWLNMSRALEGAEGTKAHYQGLTILRMGDISTNPVAKAEFEGIIERFQ